jgi:hypothetical protein
LLLLAFLALLAAGIVTVVLPELGKEPEEGAKWGVSAQTGAGTPAENGAGTP